MKRRNRGVKTDSKKRGKEKWWERHKRERPPLKPWLQSLSKLTEEKWTQEEALSLDHIQHPVGDSRGIKRVQTAARILTDNSVRFISLMPSE